MALGYICLFQFSSGGNLNSRCPSKVLEPRRLCSIPRRCPSFHGLPRFAGDGRRKARPLYSSFVNILWPSLTGTQTDIFDKYIPLIFVPKHWPGDNNPTPATEGQIDLLTCYWFLQVFYFFMIQFFMLYVSSNLPISSRLFHFWKKP